MDSQEDESMVRSFEKSQLASFLSMSRGERFRKGPFEESDYQCAGGRGASGM